MGTDAISLLVSIILFVVGLWLIITVAHGLLYLFGWILAVAAAIWLFRLISTRRT